MTSVSAAPEEDHSELRARVQSTAIASRVSAAAAVAGLAYAAATWDSAQRGVVVAVLALAALWAVVPPAIGTERVVHSARREALLLTWSGVAVLLVAVAAALDGGAGSPLALLFFPPLVVAALSYPRRSVAIVGALDVLAVAGVALTAEHASLPQAAFFAVSLALTGLLCGRQALDQGRQRQALARVSRADPLTGCLNRRGFEERLEAELDSGRRSGGRLALVVLDLDHFKAVNDTLGHHAGDDLLCWTVERASEALRPMDSLCRLGGDEFALLVPGAGPAEAQEVARRVRATLAERISVCTGVASFPADGRDRDELHRAADADLYEAKHGRVSAAVPTTTRDLNFAAALAHAVNLRMAVHEERTSAVAHYAAAIGERLGLAGAELATLRMASILHDVGKVTVPDRVLHKAGPLTAAEYELVKGHAEAGADIVARIEGLSPVASWIRHSHEHFDGSGYPNGLRGEEIPLGSRVLLVADAYDAMTSDRPYGVALPPDVALAELRLAAGTQFDPRCAEALADHLAEHPGDPGAPLGARANAARRFARPAQLPA